MAQFRVSAPPFAAAAVCSTSGKSVPGDIHTHAPGMSSLPFTQYLSLSFPSAVYRFDNDSAVSPGPECGMGIHCH